MGTPAQNTPDRFRGGACRARRLAAGVVDGLILAPVFWLITIITWPPDASGPEWGPWAVISILAFILYGAATEASAWQGTAGKRLLGLRVTDSRGDRLRLGRALARNGLKLLSLLPLGLGFLPMLRSARGQALHDLLAGSRAGARVWT